MPISDTFFINCRQEPYQSSFESPHNYYKLFLGQLASELSLDQIAHLVNDIAEESIVFSAIPVWSKSGVQRPNCCYVFVTRSGYDTLMRKIQFGVLCYPNGMRVAQTPFGTEDLLHRIRLRYEYRTFLPKNCVVFESPQNQDLF